MKAGKFYCHIEDVEPNFTTPFSFEPGLTFASVADKFCSKYNAKNGPGKCISAQLVTMKVGSKLVDMSADVAQHMTAGDDVFICGKDALVEPGMSMEPVGRSAAAPPQELPASSHPVPERMQGEAPPEGQPRPVVTPLAKKVKVYVHYESAVAERKDATATVKFDIEDADMSIGQLIEDFVVKYNSKHSDTPLEVYTLCARTDSQKVVQPDVKVCKAVSNGDDLWIVPLAVAMKEDNSTIEEVPMDANAIDKSRLRARDKSYYYWAHKPTGEMPAPREAPKQIRRREATAEENMHFKTIAKYSFESEDGFVKVYITLPGVGQLPSEGIQFDCQTRSMSLRILNYQGFNHRLQVPKLSEDIIPEQSKFIVKKDMVIVKLCKVKKDFHWYELHKTKGIGED